jgi:hypothetical protein
VAFFVGTVSVSQWLNKQKQQTKTANKNSKQKQQTKKKNLKNEKEVRGSKKRKK